MNINSNLIGSIQLQLQVGVKSMDSFEIRLIWKVKIISKNSRIQFEIYSIWFHH